MPNTNWMPAAWADKLPPEFARSPDAWLRQDGATWTLAPSDGGGIEPIALTNKQEVAFSALQSYGLVTLILRPDGSWITDPGLPPDATRFAVEGRVSASIGNLIAGGEGQEPLSPAYWDVHAYRWSDPVAWRFEHRPQARFVEAADQAIPDASEPAMEPDAGLLRYELPGLVNGVSSEVTSPTQQAQDDPSAGA